MLYEIYHRDTSFSHLSNNFRQSDHIKVDRDNCDEIFLLKPMEKSFISSRDLRKKLIVVQKLKSINYIIEIDRS